LHLVAAGDVAADGERVSAELFDGLDGVAAVLLGKVDGDDVGAFACERNGGGATDAVAGSGDEGDLAGEAASVVRGHETVSSVLMARRSSMAR
jgi:hypothetical protein